MVHAGVLRAHHFRHGSSRPQAEHLVTEHEQHDAQGGDAKQGWLLDTGQTACQITA